MTETTATTTQRSRHRTWYLAAFLFGITIIYVVVTVLTREQLEEVRNAMELQIANQETVLTSIAEVTARGGADAVVASIITDCSTRERGRFDSLLGSLDEGLTDRQLTELSRLFDRCGSFFAERKAVMVARMNREMEVFRDRIELLETVTGGSHRDRYEVAEWERLVAQEERQSELFNRLVTLQGDIIASLGSGASPESAELTALLAAVTEVRESLAVATLQASELRGDLNAL